MNYTKLDNTYFAEPQDNPRDRISVEIGDSKQKDFYPQMKIMRWDNEVNFSARLKTNVKQTPVKDGEKIKTKNIHFYDLGDGYEFEVILKEKPKTNVVEFTVEDKGVEYYYQPPLTQEEIDAGSERPENVVGSYAVYTSEEKINYRGQKEYRCGKVGHIYRPRIEDANGNWTWGNLHIENKILTVTIPQSFLDNAAYPVRHAAGLTFGYEGAGGSNQNFSANNSGGSVFSLGSSGTATKFTISQVTFNSASYKAVLILHSDLSLVSNGVGGAVAGDSSKGWKDSTFGTPPNISGSTDYVLMAVLNNTGKIYYDSGDTNQGHDAANNYTTPTGISSITHSTRKYSIYCTYDAGGGTAWTKNLTETVTPSEALAKTIGISLTETETIEESLDTTFTGAWTKTLTETVTTSEVLTKTLVKSLTESVTPSEELVKTISVNLTEDVTPSEALSKAISAILADSTTASDSLNSSYTGNYNKSLNDTLNITEELTQAAVYGRTLTDTVTVTDSLSVFLNRLSANYFIYEDGKLKLIVNGNTVQEWQ